MHNRDPTLDAFSMSARLRGHYEMSRSVSRIVCPPICSLIEKGAVSVQLTARNERRGYIVQLRTLATLELIRGDIGRPRIRLRVHVADVAPDVRWKFVHIRFGFFVRRLLRLKGATNGESNGCGNATS